MVTTQMMTLDEWYKVQDNPIQRDTEKHAAKARHLKSFHPTHAVVHAAELPNKQLIKLDGHTRALMWRRGDAPHPPMRLLCLIYPVKDLEGAEQLYKDFDSNVALETTRDKVAGAFRRHNFEPQSGLLQGGNITYALKTAYGVLHGYSANSVQSTLTSTSKSQSDTAKQIRKAEVYDMVNEFSYELHALDAFQVPKGACSSGIIAAFLLSYRKYGHKLTGFWTGVFGNKGSKIDGQMDAIQALGELILSRRGNHNNGSASAVDMCARALNAVEGYLNEKLYFRVPSPLNTTGYMVGAEIPAERLIKAADIKKKA